jgi:HK97 family phage major capsid protein
VKRTSIDVTALASRARALGVRVLNTLTIPDTIDGLEEMISDGAKMSALFADGKPTDDFGAVVKAYAGKLAARDSTIAEQVKIEVQRANAELLRNSGATKRIPLDIGETGVKAHKKGATYSNRAPGAKVDPLFPGVQGTADFFKAIYHGNVTPAASELRGQIGEIRNAYGSSVPADGGFLIPEALRAQLLETSLETAVVRPRAMVVPMDSLRVPFPTIDETTHAGSVKGGLVGYWTEEAAGLVQSQARFGRVVLDAKKLTVYGEAPNELFMDAAVSFQSFIDEKLPDAMAWFEDTGFSTGTGVGEPLGYLQADAAVAVAAEGGQTAATIKWENIVKMYSRMLPASLGRAVWVANLDTFPQLATMSLTLGTGGSAIWLNNGTAGPPMTILGRPVIFTEKCPTLGASGDINFVDFGYYLIGDRMAMQASTSPHYKFANDVTVFRVVSRVDGRPWIASAIVPASGSANTLSPFVKIAAR